MKHIDDIEMLPKGELLYVVSAYSEQSGIAYNREARLEDVADFTARLLKAGRWAHSPIAECHQYAEAHDLPYDFEFWKHFNETMLRRCDSVVVLCTEGWESSEGVQGEIGMAKQYGLPIYLFDPRRLAEEIASGKA